MELHTNGVSFPSGVQCGPGMMFSATPRGKSSLGHLYMMQALGLGNHKMYVLDRYASYDQLAKELGGELVKFDGDEIFNRGQ